jgi:hypothetical protein
MKFAFPNQRKDSLVVEKIIHRLFSLFFKIPNETYILKITFPVWKERYARFISFGFNTVVLFQRFKTVFSIIDLTEF